MSRLDAGGAGAMRWAVSTAVRPMPGETACGDAVWSRAYGERLAVAVVDGLGHGAAAATAAAATLAHLDTLDGAAWASLEGVMQGLHEALRRTRGAAVSLLRVDPTSLAFAGVGNVRCETSLAGFSPFPREGIVGYRYRGVRTTEGALEPGRIVLHTDGIGRFRIADYVTVASDALADTLLADRAEPRDDAGLAVVHLTAAEPPGKATP